ncbi:hypothetical protein [Pseudomonas sp. B22129]|uniref:hypothetical protein n=1 Tax=Pseudomonas sp. B22129 TaxID=3235111 RepID=UPI003784F8D7
MSAFERKRWKWWLVAVIAVCVAGVVAKYYEIHDPYNVEFQAFIRSQSSVEEQVGVISSVSVIKRVHSYPGFGGPAGDTPGYELYLYSVEGDRGRAWVEVRKMNKSPHAEITSVQLR